MASFVSDLGAANAAKNMPKLKMPPGCRDVTSQHGGTVFALVGVGSGMAASDDTLRRVALHEAGHAVVGRLLKIKCAGASIIPDGRGYEGSAVVAGHHTLHRDLIERGQYQDFLSSVYLKIMVTIAGSEAEKIAGFDDADLGGDDRAHVLDLCQRYSISDATVEDLRHRTHSLLVQHFHKVEAVAQALLASPSRSLTGDAIDALLKSSR